MRRAIDSEYIRKKRTSRRPRDNWRRVKKVRKMKKESDILVVASALLLMWLCSLGIMVSLVWQ